MMFSIEKQGDLHDNFYKIIKVILRMIKKKSDVNLDRRHLQMTPDSIMFVVFDPHVLNIFKQLRYLFIQILFYFGIIFSDFY